VLWLAVAQAAGAQLELDGGVALAKAREGLHGH